MDLRDVNGTRVYFDVSFLYYRKVLRTSYNIKLSTENCFAIFASEQRRGMKSCLKGHKF